jgi:predicted O-methyltransferase YrrM
MEKQPTYGENFLLAFDYKFPPVSKEIKNILYIHSTKIKQSEIIFKRLQEIFPSANLYVLQNKEIKFIDKGLNSSNVMYCSQKTIPKDFHQTEEGKSLNEKEIDIIFFGMNLNIETGNIDPLNSYVANPYENILELTKNLGLYDWTVLIDDQYCVYYPWQIEMDRVHGPKPFQMDGISMSLPWTLLSPKEKETLFKLGQSGPMEGSIVNIGYFQGGSSIILAAGSKLSKREKVFAFDIAEYPKSERFISENNLEDWIVFEKESSVQAAKKWTEKENNGIRLLLIDGDHSYEGCKDDIQSWKPYLVSGGVIAIHDYGNISEGSKYSEVVQAVYDTILNSSEFKDFRRVDTLFMATKI